MKENKLKKRLKQGKACFGVLAPTVDPVICEYIGLTGFDYYMIDGEHGTITPSDIGNLVRACEGTNCTPLARISKIDAKLILQYMDAGVMGVMMPTVQNADEVKALVDAVKYPPVGKRGLGPVRSADYLQGKLSQEEYLRFSNEQTLIIPQVETLACVENLEAICAIPEVDGFIIGPMDLAVAMGYYDGLPHQEVQDMIDKIIKIILANGKFFGTVATSKAQAEGLLDKGALLLLNTVQELIKSAGREFLSARK